MRRLRPTLLVAAAVWTATAALPAQQRFRSTTSLLILDVSVLDRDGQPVADLAPEDFVVSLNGEKQSVQTLAFLATTSGTATTLRVPVGAPAPAVLAPAGSNGEPDPRLFVILVDDMSIYPTESKGLFVAAERFVESIPARDWVGFTTTSGLVTVNPSLDRTLLLRKLKRTFGWMNDPRKEAQLFVGLMEALLIDDGSQAALRDAIERDCGLSGNILAGRNLAQILTDFPCAHDVEKQARYNASFARSSTRNQLDTYAAVIKAMAPAPGVKQLVILTGGVALAPQHSPDFVPVAKAAAAAGVQITMLMEEPDVGDGAYATDQQQLLQEAQTLAEMSGGQFFRVIGQADRFYERVLTSASAVYRIGVDLPKTVPPDGKYGVSVKVNRPGVRVLASRYAAPPPPPAVLTPEERMQHAIRTGEPSYEVPVQMTAEAVASSDGSTRTIRVTVEVPGDTPGPISGIFGMIGPGEQLKSGHRNLARSADGKSYGLDFLVPVTPATYDLRFAVSDATGALGAIAQKIVVK